MKRIILVSRLNEKQINKLKPKEKRFKESLADNFYVEVMPTGQKFYRVRGLSQTITIGNVSDINLEDALSKAEQIIFDILNPDLAPKTFTDVFNTWTNQKEWAESTRKKRQSIIDNYLQIFKKRAIQDIRRVEVLEEIRKIETQGKYETAYKALCILRQVFQYALICGYIETNPASELHSVLKRQISVPRPALIAEKDVQKLVNGIYALQKDSIRALFKFTMFTLCRPSECRLAKWGEIEGNIWKIPASRMKLRKEHIVPLSTQCLAVLEEMKSKLTSNDPDFVKDRYIFPSHIRGRALSENTLMLNLKHVGFSRDDMSIHGFRSMGSTILNEKGYRHDVIEKALAHAGEDKIRAIYNRAEYFNERRQMLQDYADYLESLLITNKKEK